MIRHDKMQAIGAVGNKGALFTCEKVFGYNRQVAFDWYETLKRFYPEYKESSEKGLMERIAFVQALRKEGIKYGLHFDG